MKRCFLGIQDFMAQNGPKYSNRQGHPASVNPGLLTFACDSSIFRHVKLGYHLQAMVLEIRIQNSYDCIHYSLRELQRHLKYHSSKRFTDSKFVPKTFVEG